MKLQSFQHSGGFILFINTLYGSSVTPSNLTASLESLKTFKLTYFHFTRQFFSFQPQSPAAGNSRIYIVSKKTPNYCLFRHLRSGKADKQRPSDSAGGGRAERHHRGCHPLSPPPPRRWWPPPSRAAQRGRPAPPAPNAAASPPPPSLRRCPAVHPLSPTGLARDRQPDAAVTPAAQAPPGHCQPASLQLYSSPPELDG